MASVPHLGACLRPAPLPFGHWDVATSCGAPRKPCSGGALGCSRCSGARPGHQVSEQGLPRQLHWEGTSPLGRLERRAIRFYSGDSIFFLLHQINTGVTPLTTGELLLS